MPSQEAQTVDRVLLEMCITGSGFHVNLHTVKGKGSNFMSELFSENCRIIGNGRTSATERQGLKKWIDQWKQSSQSAWMIISMGEKNFQLVMIAYCPSVHALLKNYPSDVSLGTTMRLAIDCLHEQRHTIFFPAPSHLVFKVKTQQQRTQQSVTAEIGR